MMMRDEGGGSTPRPTVRSDVQVDPGDIRDFARFLDEMSQRVAEIENQFAPYADGSHPVDFGAHTASSRATDHHRKAVTAAHANLAALRARVAELGEGTVLLARSYTDTEDLNHSLATDIGAALRRGKEA